MATLFSDQITTINAGGVRKANEVGGKLRAFYFSFATTGHANADVVELFKVPANARFFGGEIHPSATMGAVSSAQIGWAGDPDALRAAGTLVAADTFGLTLAENFMTETTAQTTVILTYSAADPADITIKGVVYVVIE